MKLGIVFPHHEIGTDPGAVKAYAEGAEALGAEHMLIYDHVLGADPDRPGGWSGPYDKDVAFHEPFTVFAFMAAVTTRIEFATSVLILPQRQTALVAKQAAELAILSGNRFRLGIGSGWNEVEYEALGVPFAARGRRQAEQVELLRQLWASDSLTYGGRFHTVTQASILPRPSAPIPIWFGGGAAALLERCATIGEGWFPPRRAEREVRRRHCRAAPPSASRRPAVGRFRHPGPGAVPRRQSAALAQPRRALARPWLHPSRHRHAQRWQCHRGRPSRRGAQLLRRRGRTG